MAGATEQPEGPRGAGAGCAAWGPRRELESDDEDAREGPDLPRPAVAGQACPSASR